MRAYELRDLWAHAIAERASDIHLVQGHPPILRIDGDLVPLETEILRPATIARFVKELLSETAAQSFAQRRAVDFSVALEGGFRGRGHMYFTDGAPAVALRLIPQTVPTLADLGAPAILAELSALDHGLILVTGPAGSGKSTTLAAMVAEINRQYSKHIVTIEDPIEFVHPLGRSLVTQRQVGRDALTFADGLRDCLREDPNVILIGELRDYETIRLALQAAETGHLVLGTLTTSTAAEAIDRFVDSFPGDEKLSARAFLANCLKGVIAQTLLKRKSAKGRVAAFEVLVANPAVHSLIREGRTDQLSSVMQTASGAGMQTLEGDIRRLARQGLIAADSRVVLPAPSPPFNFGSSKH
jgi:twitching motility protein PilT